MFGIVDARNAHPLRIYDEIYPFAPPNDQVRTGPTAAPITAYRHSQVEQAIFNRMGSNAAGGTGTCWGRLSTFMVMEMKPSRGCRRFQRSASRLRAFPMGSPTHAGIDPISSSCTQWFLIRERATGLEVSRETDCNPYLAGLHCPPRQPIGLPPRQGYTGSD